MIEEVIADGEDRMKKTVEAVQRELGAIRTGHAHVGLVDHVRVEYFGSMLPVNQMATVAAPESRLLTIQPWDRNAMSAIEKALQKSDLGLTPSNDGNTIRLAIPPLTEQRRKELIRIVHQRIEDGRVAWSTSESFCTTKRSQRTISARLRTSSRSSRTATSPS
jgi:ribosome recycling factor